jgi:hypothetical protein
MGRPSYFALLALSILLAAPPAWAAKARKATEAETAEQAGPEEFRLGVSTAGYTYFNQPGADIARHDEELKACLRESIKVLSPDEQMHAGSTGILDILIGGLIVDALSDGVRPSAVENCMVVRGWRVVALPEAEGKALNELPAQDISKALEPWVGAETPNGQIVRDGFHNEAITAKTKRFELRPPGENRYRLSAKSLGDFLKKEREQQNEERKQLKQRGESPVEPFEPYEAKAIKKAEKVYAPPGTALIIVNMKNLSQRNGIFIEFQRMDDASNTLAEGSKAAPNILLSGAYLLGARKDANWRAYAVPPGRWRLAKLNMVYENVNLCMGSPAFEAKEGEVIYAGTFDMGGDTLGPDLSLDLVKTWLNGQAGTENVQPAAYSNGWTGECGSSSIYALEFNDVPFRENYHWGSRIVAAAATGTPAMIEDQPVAIPAADSVAPTIEPTEGAPENNPPPAALPAAGTSMEPAAEPVDGVSQGALLP